MNETKALKRLIRRTAARLPRYQREAAIADKRADRAWDAYEQARADAFGPAGYTGGPVRESPPAVREASDAYEQARRDRNEAHRVMTRAETFLDDMIGARANWRREDH